MIVRWSHNEDRAWILSLMEEYWGGPMIERTGHFIDALTLPGFVAVERNRRLGLITLLHEASHIEIVTLNSLRKHRGIGSVLLQAAEAEAAARGVSELRVFTSNDNVDALRFYQRRGFRLEMIYKDAISRARKVKPSIPHLGHYRIPIMDEIELRKVLCPQTVASEGVTC